MLLTFVLKGVGDGGLRRHQSDSQNDQPEQEHKQAVQEHPGPTGFKQSIRACPVRLFREGLQHISARVFHREQIEGGEFLLSTPHDVSMHILNPCVLKMVSTTKQARDFLS